MKLKDIKNIDDVTIDQLVDALHNSIGVSKESLYKSFEEMNEPDEKDRKYKFLQGIYFLRNKLKIRYISEIKRFICGNQKCTILLGEDNGDIKVELVTSLAKKKGTYIRNSNLKNFMDDFIKSSFSVKELESFILDETLRKGLYNKKIIEFEQENKFLNDSMRFLTSQDINARTAVISKELENNNDLSERFEKYYMEYLADNLQYLDTNKLLAEVATKIMN